MSPDCRVCPLVGASVAGVLVVGRCVVGALGSGDSRRTHTTWLQLNTSKSVYLGSPLLFNMRRVVYTCSSPNVSSALTCNHDGSGV